MLNDLAALTPPFVVCAAILIAVGAFLRQEMRRNKGAAEDDDAEAEVSAQVSGESDRAIAEATDRVSGDGDVDPPDPK